MWPSLPIEISHNEKEISFGASADRDIHRIWIVGFSSDTGKVGAYAAMMQILISFILILALVILSEIRLNFGARVYSIKKPTLCVVYVSCFHLCSPSTVWMIVLCYLHWECWFLFQIHCPGYEIYYLLLQWFCICVIASSIRVSLWPSSCQGRHPPEPNY